MTRLVILAKFEADAIAMHLANSGQIFAEAEQWAASKSIEVREMAFTTGIYDLVVILEGEDQATMMGFIAAVNAVAKCTTQTLTAVGDIARVLDAANDGYGRMGQGGGG
jgi:uncharacterized protein with GYD domain